MRPKTSGVEDRGRWSYGCGKVGWELREQIK